MQRVPVQYPWICDIRVGACNEESPAAGSRCVARRLGRALAGDCYGLACRPFSASVSASLNSGARVTRPLLTRMPALTR